MYPPGERLQKILSAAGIASRRAAETLITQGRVSVNGTTVLELGTRAHADSDDIRVDGQRIRIATRRRYILLHKPRGYMTTRKDPQRRDTVFDLLPDVRDYVYPVGRLDYDSEGLILLTNDGELADRLMHPRHEVDREYAVRVRGIPNERALERLRAGVVIDGRRTARSEVRVVEVGLGAREDQALLSVVLHEGRTRQVRNMCEAVGHPVVRLRRVRIGPISDPDLRVGAHRDLTPREVVRLQQAAGVGEAVPDVKSRETAHGSASRPSSPRPASPGPQRLPRVRPAGAVDPSAAARSGARAVQSPGRPRDPRPSGGRSSR